MTLATPAIFHDGWKPGWLDDRSHGTPFAAGPTLKLVGVCIQRWRAVSGWSYKAGGPKAIRRMVPAGGVYFFERTATTSRDLAEPLAAAGLRRRAGSARRLRAGGVGNLVNQKRGSHEMPEQHTNLLAALPGPDARRHRARRRLHRPAGLPREDHQLAGLPRLRLQGRLGRSLPPPGEDHAPRPRTNDKLKAAFGLADDGQATVPTPAP